MENSSSGSIKPIDHNTVHRICSGQVVLTLAVAVKELVENSLDSGATTVEVRLKEFGSESVEVTDDGHGISPSNFENLCLKHYTSKIEQFEDLISVQTFGFRGEALSSLCALSTLSVTTCEKGNSLGWKLEYDHNGKLVKQSQYSRQPGTTVTLVNLFSSLPVRHKEFLKNLKREFAKMVNLLTGYCLISQQTRITCTNSTSGKTTVVLSTRGGASLKDNFTLVFGLKSWQNMLELKAVKPSEDIFEEFNLNLNAVPSMMQDWPFQFEGFISSCVHGQGRSCADRQYYFINGRPCDPAKVSKLVNEIYHSYNRNQYPTIVLNITTQSSQVDINVTPDKRQLMLTNEKLLLATVKASLTELYCKLPSTFTLQNTSLTSKPLLQPTDLPGTPFTPIQRLRSSLSAFAAAGWSPNPSSPGQKRKVVTSPPAAKQQLLDQYVMSNAGSPLEKKTKYEICNPEPPVVVHHTEDNAIVLTVIGKDNVEEREESLEIANVADEVPMTPVNDIIKDLRSHSSDTIEIIDTIEELESAIDDVLSQTNPQQINRLKVNVTFDLSSLLKAKSRSLNDFSTQVEERRFLSRISPDDAASAEAELSRQINQADFKKMEIVGQFNLGFIIARLNADLFIIDQHAADEKFNFEMLQRTTKLNPQKLVCPKQLNLTAANESLLLDNLNIFRSNGFEFVINKDENPSKRVSLSSVPMSGNWLLGPSDIDEILFLLQDSPTNQEDDQNSLSQTLMARYRPSRIRSMFASRACRKAVMVGHPLTLVKMKSLVQQMSELQQPWNCPHGRPTMRHLINIDILK